MVDIRLEDIKRIGHGLARPECVLCTSNGRVYASDWRGGVTVLEPDGTQWSVLAPEAGPSILPNGICLLADGSFLLCHLGAEHGGVYRLDANGRLEPFLLEVDGAVLPPTNYAHLDRLGRIWVTVSTRRVPRADGYRPDVADGFIVLVDAQGARIVADGLGYANECVVTPDGRSLFVNETFARRLTRFYISEGGDLAHRETVAEFGAGTFPDGLVLDADGGLWITSIVSNRVIRVVPDGTQSLVVEDSDPTHVAWVEDAFRAGCMGRPHLDTVAAKLLRNVSSLAFGGPSLRRACLGCLLGTTLFAFASPVAGLPPAHWAFAGPRRPGGNRG